MLAKREIKQFIQVRYASGFPATPWFVQLVNWPFIDETFAAKRELDEAIGTARAIASVRGLPIATPAHVVMSELEKAQGEGPEGFDYKFWWTGDYSDVEPEWNREDYVGE